MKATIKAFGKFLFEKNYIYEEHQHLEHEINYVHSGQCIMVVDGKSIVLHKGDCIFIPPMLSHNFIVSGNQCCEIMQIELLINNCTQFVKHNHCHKLSKCTDIVDSLNYLYKYEKNKKASEYYNVLFELELEKLFVIIAMHAENEMLSQKKCEQKHMKEVFEYIDNNYMNNINLNDLAHRNNISSRYLRKLFLESTGLSAIDYITALRLEKAKDLLKNSKCSVSQVTFDVGYSTCQYFSSTFKKKIGITPKEFRQQYNI